MAAGDFSASVKFNIQAILGERFADGPSKWEFTRQVETAKTMLARQINSVDPVLVGGRCIGFNVYWVKSGDDDLYYNGDGTTPTLTLNCDLPAAKEMESAAQTYTDNVRMISVVQVDDDKCNNLFDLERLSALELEKAMYRIRKAFNVRWVNFLNSSKQANLDTEVTSLDNGNGAWAVNADLATIEVPTADTADPDAFALLDSVVKNNNFPGSYFLMSGRFNWYNSAYNSQYKALNDDQRSDLASYNDHDIHFDIRDLDATLTGKNTFAVDPSAYVFWNRVYSEATPNKVESDNGPIWEFTIEDPELMTLQPTEGGGSSMQPLKYEVAYQKVCDGRDTNTKHKHLHKYEVKLLGGLALAPAGVNSETGIMKFAAVDAV